LIIVGTPRTDQPAVELLVDAMPAGTSKVTIWRTFDGERSVLRDADGSRTGGALARPYTDWEVPLGKATVYQVYAYNTAGAVLGSAQSTPVTVAATSAWISDPLAPGTACAVSPINESFETISHDVQGDIASVIESGLPVAVMGAMGVASSVPLLLNAPTPLIGLMIRTVLRSGPVFLLRLPPLDHPVQLPALAYIAATGGYDDVRVYDHDWISVKGCVVVAPPISPVVLAARTYGDVRDEASTYGDVQLQHATYLGLLRGDAF
jgi:hypothetical protein